ncbi:tetratricopeptide repeat protein [Candidatus Laterigemmans baculatus]|uniref:tetratricopeptide repeat-containing glycosyltransferase family protein n=1 Tax=Candidatus Laterigemmans baculatus TaxID=2770505 RepID=UPI0013DC98A2|nr:tetratricopeptide repeat-containing glycosyltransferase family protein [Candidatus Laterigemmans baculatus]
MITVGEALQRAWQTHQRGQIAAAEHAYREVIRAVPANPEAHVYLGIALFDQLRYDEAAAAYREGLRLRDHFPVAWNNLGNALRMLGRIDEADAAFATALRQKSDYANALKNRGTLWVWAGHIERGLEWYQQAMRLAPDDAELHRNLGIIYLLQGRYDEGWPEYRWRWKMPGMPRPSLPLPLWQGEPLEGKSIFVYPEQGLGDAIQFVRVVETLQERGATVVLGCDPKLLPLLSGVRGVGKIIPFGGTFDRVDYHASLVDATDHTWQGEAQISGAPYLEISESLAAYWQRYLEALPGKRIGLCWQGNPAHHADPYRSVPLAAFAPLMELPNVSWISLQHGHGSEQLTSVEFGDRLHRLPENLDQSSGAFLDTAAVMRGLDLVITTDTSAGHLAGALGVPTWLLLGRVPDWRWGLRGSTTPWYAAHRLWRQQEVGDWQTPIADMAEELRERR